MIVDVLRQVADWLSDGLSGVNTLLGALPDDVGDTVPPNVTVVDVTRNEWIARGVVHRDKIGAGPLLIVSLGAVTDVPLRTDAADASVPVVVQYVARKATTDELVTECLQTLRAAARVLAARFSPVVGALTRNETDLAPPDVARLTIEFTELEGDELIVGRLELSIPATDAWGLAAVS